MRHDAGMQATQAVAQTGARAENLPELPALPPTIAQSDFLTASVQSFIDSFLKAVIMRACTDLLHSPLGIHTVAHIVFVAVVQDQLQMCLSRLQVHH